MQTIQGTQQHLQQPLPPPPPPQHPLECDFPQFPRDGGGGSGSGTGGGSRSNGSGAANGVHGDHDAAVVAFANGVGQVSVSSAVGGVMQAASGAAHVALVDLSNGATVAAQQPQVPAAAASTENGGGGGSGSGGSTASLTGSSGTATTNNNVVTMCQCILVLDPFPSQSVWR